MISVHLQLHKYLSRANIWLCYSQILDSNPTYISILMKPFLLPLMNMSIYSWICASNRLGSEGQLSEFIEGLGPGQLVGRQVLASPALGDIQLSMSDRKGNLEVEVIRARGLQCKPGSKTLPGKV